MRVAVTTGGSPLPLLWRSPLCLHFSSTKYRLPVQVADVCVDSLVLSEAANKVVEVITAADEPNRPVRDLFAGVYL